MSRIVLVQVDTCIVLSVNVPVSFHRHKCFYSVGNIWKSLIDLTEQHTP